MMGVFDMSVSCSFFWGCVIGLLLSYPYYLGSGVLFGDWALLFSLFHSGMWIRCLHIRLEV